MIRSLVFLFALGGSSALAHPGHGMPEGHSHGEIISAVAVVALFLLVWFLIRPSR